MAEKERKPNIFSRLSQSLRQFFKETIGELRKVSWPTWAEAKNLTLIVLMVIGFMTVVLGVWDFACAQVLGFIQGL